MFCFSFPPRWVLHLRRFYCLVWLAKDLLDGWFVLAFILHSSLVYSHVPWQDLKFEQLCSTTVKSRALQADAGSVGVPKGGAPFVVTTSAHSEPCGGNLGFGYLGISSGWAVEYLWKRRQDWIPWKGTLFHNVPSPDPFSRPLASEAEVLSRKWWVCWTSCRWVLEF